MANQLITYKKFNDAALAVQLTQVLEKNGIEYLVEEQFTNFNPTFYADETAKDYAVKISAADFNRANEVLIAEDTENLGDVAEDHYLFAFTDEELKDLIFKRDEWSSFDYLLAQKILKDRGVDLSEHVLAKLHEKRLEELTKPEPPQTFWIVMGYIFALFGGILGIFIGWYLHTGKKTLPNGEKVFEFTDGDRRQGKVIMYLSIVGMALGFIAKLIARANY